MGLAQDLPTLAATVEALRNAEGDEVRLHVGKDPFDRAPVEVVGRLSRDESWPHDGEHYRVGRTAWFTLTEEQFEGAEVHLYEQWLHYSVEIRTGGYLLTLGEAL
jgi:hypothetical protein